MADKKLNVTRGLCHDYLWMTVNFSSPGTVIFDMIPYITKIFAAFLEKIMGVFSTPVADHLFNICLHDKAKHLPKEQARAFHHTTAQLLFFPCPMQYTNYNCISDNLHQAT
jgi:hypothetical protein